MIPLTFSPTYRPNEANHCPGCGRCNWHIGRLLAECGFCATAIPLENARTGTGRPIQQRKASNG